MVVETTPINTVETTKAKMQTEAKEYDTYARQDPYSSPMKSSIPSSTVVALFPETVATKRLVDNPQKHNWFVLGNFRFIGTFSLLRYGGLFVPQVFLLDNMCVVVLCMAQTRKVLENCTEQRLKKEAVCKTAQITSSPGALPYAADNFSLK